MLLSVNGNKLLFECFIKANDSKHPLSPLSPDLWEKTQLSPIILGTFLMCFVLLLQVLCVLHRVCWSELYTSQLQHDCCCIKGWHDLCVFLLEKLKILIFKIAFFTYLATPKDLWANHLLVFVPALFFFKPSFSSYCFCFFLSQYVPQSSVVFPFRLRSYREDIWFQARY